MKRVKTMLWGILFIGFATQMAIASGNGEERYILTRKSPVRISVETGWQRKGLIPVRIEIQGLIIELMMDSIGRVFDNAHLEIETAEKRRGGGHGLFSLDKTSGQLHAGDIILSGQVFEQNELRTRLRLDNLALALQLDIQKSWAALDLNGIIIPIQVRLGKESGDMRELEIGERSHRGEGTFLLDVKQDRLFFENSRFRLEMENRQSSMVCWAEKQKQ